MRAHLDPIFELDFPARIDGHALERLAGLVVGLAATLQGLQNGALIDASRGLGRDRTSNVCRSS